jgi:hypothetical protein
MFSMFAVVFICVIAGAAIVTAVEILNTRAALFRARAEVKLLSKALLRDTAFDPDSTAEEEIDPTVYDERRQPDPNKPVSKGRYFQ